MLNAVLATERFEDRREIKNLMGKYVSSLLLNWEGKIFDSFWSKSEDVSLGFNNGYYKGADAVRGYFDAVAQATALKSKTLQGIFPEKLGKLSDEELYGVGPFEVKPLTSPYIITADDGMTGKGIWMVQGHNVDIETSGPVSYWTWGSYAADFIKEDGQWKLWHVLYVEDIHCISGQDWASEQAPYPELPEFKAIAGIKLPQPNVPMTVREIYSPARPLKMLPMIPKAYATFAETFSYGV